MDESNFIKNISIIGLGQIGGSLALSFKKYLKNVNITGWDLNTNLLHKANMLDKTASSLEDACKNTDIIFLATPIDSILKLIPKIININTNALLCDVGSTKKTIVKKVNSIKTNFRFISTHPLAGTEKHGTEAWNDSLFEGKTFFITITKKSNKKDIKLIKNIIKSIKANPVIISASKHDKILAYTSHLPYLIALALQNTVKDLNIKNQHIFEGPSYQSITRLTKCLESVMNPILKSNKLYISQAINAFISNLLTNDYFKT